MADPSKLRDNLSRVKKSSPLGTTIFVGLRLLDPLLQHAILARNLGSALIHRLGAQTIAEGAPLNDITSLSPYRVVLLSMAIGSSVKQIFWILSISQEEFTPKIAFPIASFNTLFNSANSLLFICASTSASGTGGQGFSEPGFPSTALVVGAGSYLVGMILETASEVQRKRFKKDPQNEGKNYSGGLFSLARHINYGGYTLWRAGYALASGGWIWGAIIGGLFFYDFANRGIPILDYYCQQRVRGVVVHISTHIPDFY
jgi:protein-S-isoprenylcysteine O-methyltransferase Ste14